MATIDQLALPADLIADLQRVDQVVIERIKARSMIVRIAGQHLLTAEARRLRATLTLLTAQLLGNYQVERVLHVAGAVELIHTAALVHADLVNEAERRRGAQSDQPGWDHGVALMVGDYFFALSAGEMALVPDPRVITFFSHAVMKICEGQLAPVMQAAPLDAALEQYYRTAGARTAALFAAACKAGMAVGGGSDAQIDQIGRFGYAMGLACQIMNEVHDFAPAPDAAPGSTLRRGVITLPLIYAVAAAGNTDLAAVVDTQDAARQAWGVAEVQRLGLDTARSEARRLIDEAHGELAAFPAGPAHQLLYDVARLVVQPATHGEGE